MRLWLVPNRTLRSLALALSAALFCSCLSAPQRQAVSPASGASSESGRFLTRDDKDLQRAAVEALGDREGTVLLMDTQTGRLRAVVNPRLAFEQAFPPGSTIKSFTALMALRAGLIDADYHSLCRGTFKRGDFQIVCSHPKSKSPFNVEQALAYSCNCFFAGLAERLSPAAFRSTLASYGFGARTGINAPEATGNISAGEWHVKDGVGEGDALLVTPIQLLTSYTALFNGGHLLRPQLAGADKFKTEEKARLPIDEFQRALLVKGCRGAVDYGTAAEAAMDSLPFFVFGKTGTAVASNEFRRYGWFVGFASDQDSSSSDVAAPESLRLAVLVFLKRGHGWEAAAIAKRILDGETFRSASGKFDDVAQTSAFTISIKSPDGSTRKQSIPNPRPVRVRLLRENRTLTLPLEEYVLGVVAIEASVEDQPEALKAQAIISRTYALKNLGRHAAQGFDLCSNTHCQQFVTGSRAVIRNAVRLAVNETAGEVLVDRQGRLVDGYYNASCGGMTANIETLWGQPAPSYLKGVRDDYCLTGPHSKWTDRIPRERLLKALRSDPRSNVGGFLESISVTTRDATGRAQRIALDGEHRRELSGWEFKLIVGRALGWNLIKSTRFDLSRHGSVYVFRGSGFGHGLGLCQEGAHVMARRGSDYHKILAFYFPQTGIEQVSSNSSAAETRRGATEASFVRASFSPGGSTAQSSVLSRSSEHFRIRYPYGTNEVEIEAVLQILEAARTVMTRKLRAASLSLSERPISVVFHATTQDFTAATGQPWFASGATGDFKIDMQPISRLRQRRILASTLRHEYAHTAIEALGGKGCPRWLVEGLAIHFAGEAPALMRTRAARRSVPLRQLERMLANPASQVQMREAYIGAYSEVARRINNLGESTVWRSLRSCANSA